MKDQRLVHWDETVVRRWIGPCYNPVTYEVPHYHLTQLQRTIQVLFGVTGDFGRRVETGVSGPSRLDVCPR
jgi:hypothetical protein